MQWKYPSKMTTLYTFNGLLTLFLLTSTCHSRTTENHHRSKRLTAASALEYGCAAVTAVRQCTDLLEDCKDVCESVDAACQEISDTSGLVAELCKNEQQLKLKQFFEEELPKLAKGGSETKKALEELGDHFEALGDKILGGINSVKNAVKDKFDGLFRQVAGEGCRVVSSVPVIVAGFMLVKHAN